MNPLILDIVRVGAFLGALGITAACGIFYFVKNLPAAKPATGPTPIPAEQLPPNVRQAAPPQPRYDSSSATESARQTSASALKVFQDFGDTLISLGVPQDEVAAILDPHAKLLLKKGGK